MNRSGRPPELLSHQFRNATFITTPLQDSSLQVSSIVGGTIPAIRRLVYGLLGITTLGGLFLTNLPFEILSAYLIISLSSLAALHFVIQRNRNGLPVAGAFIFQHGIAYGFPVFQHADEYTTSDTSVMLACAGQYSLFMLVLIAAWSFGTGLVKPRPSKLLLRSIHEQGDNNGKLTTLALGVLLFGFCFQLAFYTELYWTLFGSLAERLFSVIRGFAILSQVVGAFLGAYLIRCSPRIRSIYWVVWISLFVLLVSSILLSSATSLVLATCAGLFLGSRRIPWITVILILCTLAFLNQGKFVMRAKYWGTSSNPGLLELPGFFVEWASASAQYLFTDSGDIGGSEDQGQSLADRLNNFGNLLFVNRAITLSGFKPANGAGYAFLPSVFVPRIFWPGKPRTHEGQVTLNLHFGRQISYEATETTYVAWGLLPESQGNLGLWMGPIALGIVAGLAFGAIETWSSGKDLASIEGLGAFILLISAVTSFEMSLGVLLAMIFQTAVALIIGGIFIRSLLRTA